MIRLFRQYISLRKTIFVFGEGILIYFAVILASFFLLDWDIGLIDLIEMIWAKTLLVAIVTQISLYFSDLYEFKMDDDLIGVATHLIQSIGVTSIILAIIYFLIPDVIIGRWIFFFSVLFLLLFLVSWRLLYTVIITRRLFSEKTLIIGCGELAQGILEEIHNRKDISYDIRSIINPTPEDQNLKNQLNGIQVCSGFENLYELAKTEDVDSIIVALDQKRGIMPYQELLNCKLNGINIIDGESFYERITGKLLVEKINPSWLIFSDGFIKSRTSRFTKRLVGLILSIIMFISLFPLIILVAITIKLESAGPVFFSQERVGEDGKTFTLYKFRSMRSNAEEKTGPVWAENDDPRVTRVGKIIRKLRIDELPQLWNVLKGDMSFVGPRPERPFFVERLKSIVPYYNERQTVKPGVTGWAQVRYPYGATDEDALEKLKYDLYYIKNMSIVMDFIVIFQTVKIVLLGRGSR
ncbi:TIGR03013 family XrtA/PEP-CTERM system glycosyltransferase [Thermodesulfobacteriota bacterium]